MEESFNTSKNNNIRTFENHMAYDPGDSEFNVSDKEDKRKVSWLKEGDISSENESQAEDLFDESTMLQFAKKKKKRKISEIASKAQAQSMRKHGLVEIREHIQTISNDGIINQAQLQTLLSDRNFCILLFNLFDEKSYGILEQQIWFDKLKYWTQVSSLPCQSSLT